MQPNKNNYDTSVVIISDQADEARAPLWCSGYGFHVRGVQRWLDLTDPATFGLKKNAILKKCWAVAELQQAANYSSESNEWFTPARYLEAVHEVMGGVDLDPASNPQANAVVRADKFFSIDDDGLQQDWFGRVFMNPPYGKAEDKKSSLAGAFCNKAVEQYECGNVQSCIILVNSLHSQSWQAALYDYPICFVDHRIQFVSGDGEKKRPETLAWSKKHLLKGVR